MLCHAVDNSRRLQSSVQLYIASHITVLGHVKTATPHGLRTDVVSQAASSQACGQPSLNSSVTTHKNEPGHYYVVHRFGLVPRGI